MEENLEDSQKKLKSIDNDSHVQDKNKIHEEATWQDKLLPHNNERDTFRITDCNQNESIMKEDKSHPTKSNLQVTSIPLTEHNLRKLNLPFQRNSIFSNSASHKQHSEAEAKRFPDPG